MIQFFFILIKKKCFLDCLKYMCRELSMIVLEHQVWIMTIFERLLFLHPTVANQVLFAIFPLARISPNIRENLLLTLRKALYRKGVSKRQMAVTGFLEMLKCTKMRSQLSFRLSQHSNSMISSSSRSSLTHVCIKIILYILILFLLIFEKKNIVIFII